jgi:hypothetical protein
MERRAAIEAAVEHLPLMLTVEQARAVLGIGRSLAYGEVRRYLATGGREGIPAVRIGSVVRVPRTALVELLASVTTPTAAAVAVPRGRRPPASVAALFPLPPRSPSSLEGDERHCGPAAVRGVGLRRSAMSSHPTHSLICRHVPAGGV